MKLLRFLLALNICLVAYFGSLHTLTHNFDVEHDASCMECLATRHVGHGHLGHEAAVEILFEIVFEELVVVSQSTSVEYIGTLPLSRGPPSSLV